MFNKRILKFTIDLLMTFLLIILMNYNFTGNKLHEIIGTLMLVICIFHNILNIHWYKSLGKRKYTNRRITHLIVNILVIFCTLTLLISGVMISSTVFSFIHFGSVSLGRKVHLLSSYWGFILISVHLGLHHNILIKKSGKKLSTLIISAICINGIYTIIKREILQNLFLINQYTIFNSNESIIIFIIDYLSLMILVICITSLLIQQHSKTMISK